MRKASWILTLLFGAFLAVSAPIPGTSEGVHVSNRFVQKSLDETGMASPILAIAGDYRSFDTLLLCLLWFCVSVACLLPNLSQVPTRASQARTWGSALLACLGLGIALLLGFDCVRGGNNFLDFEPLARFFPSEEVRPSGAFLLGVALLISALGSVLAFTDRKSAGEGSHGR